ncbi:MAG: hypothetical protein LBB59_06280 [Campylobacteraceae bacterium]|jgi:uncharacterized protein|nr:hypothetical protein [Campylobacteraceae bacterium]
MYKIILILVLIYIAYILFFGKKRGQKEEKNSLHEELMVECAACGTFVAMSEAVRKEGQYFCSQTCAKAKK